MTLGRDDKRVRQVLSVPVEDNGDEDLLSRLTDVVNFIGKTQGGMKAFGFCYRRAEVLEVHEHTRWVHTTHFKCTRVFSVNPPIVTFSKYFSTSVHP